jgi:hypothetical protein
MIDPKKININQLPKKFADGALGAYGKEFFSFAITSGNNLDSFATTPKTMKSIAVWMNKQVENYEKTYGEIDMTPPKVVSPIQASDLGKDGDSK